MSKLTCFIGLELSKLQLYMVYSTRRVIFLPRPSLISLVCRPQIEINVSEKCLLVSPYDFKITLNFSFLIISIVGPTFTRLGCPYCSIALHGRTETATAQILNSYSLKTTEHIPIDNFIKETNRISDFSRSCYLNTFPFHKTTAERRKL